MSGMKTYRQSVAHLKPMRRDGDGDGKLSAAEMKALRKTVRQNSYRQSWHPAWMLSNTWIGTMELPEELELDITDKEDAKFPDSRHSRYIDPSDIEAHQDTLSQWEQSEMRDKWFPLLCNVARAVTQSTPWGDPNITKEVRQGILIALLKRFLDHSGDRQLMATQTKEMLRMIRDEDPTMEIQLSLISFMDGRAWEGADSYRDPSNWNNIADLEAFRDSLDALVQQRLHHINGDISKSEARMTDAIDQWNQIHHTSLCFGGGVHEVIPLDERLVKGKSSRHSYGLTDSNSGGSDIAPRSSIRSVTSQGSSPYLRSAISATPYKSRYADNQIHLRLHELFVAGVNPSTGRQGTIPNRMTIHATYMHDGVVADAHEIVGRMRPCGDRIVWTGSEVSFTIPKAFPQGDPEGFRNIDRCEIVITMEQIKTCGWFGGTHVAQIVIPVRSLYEDACPLHGGERAEIGEERRNANDDREVGIHYCRRNFVDIDSGIGIDVTLTMECCVEIHNRTPPRVDVEVEMARLTRRVDERRGNVWEIDHHAQIIELAELLGELTDAENYALQLYADRFLIHPELLQVLCLVAFATKGNFNDYETREGMVEACDVLAGLKDTLQTKKAQELCEKGLSLAQRQCLERILSIEDVSDNPDNGTSIMDACLKILEMMDVNEWIVTALVEERAIEYGEYISRKLRKLLGFLGSENGDARMSVLVELQQKDDNDSLLAKARAFYEIMDSALFVLTSAVQFAIDTKDKRIQNLAYRRANLILERLFDPINKDITAFFGEMAKATQSDPLGDAFGVITLLYERIMEFVCVIDEVEPLEANCIKMVEPFNNFLPSWFSMCQLKVPTWIRAIIESEALEAIAPGKIFCNSTPADAKNLIEALFAVFDKVIDWVDPEATHMYVTNFAKLVLLLVECFTEALTEKALDSVVPEEWMVALCSMTKFETTIQLFWQVKVFNGICQTFGEADGLLVYQCQSLKASCLENISLKKDELTDFISASMRGAALAFLEEAAETANDPFGTKDQFNAVFGEVITNCVKKEMSLIADNTDKVTAPLVLIRAAKGLHASFADFAVRQGGHLSVTNFKERMLEALAAIESSLGEFSGFDMIPPEVLFDLAHRSRAVLNVVCQPTSDIIDTLESSRAAEMIPSERDQLLNILKQRKNDKVAIKYIKSLRK